MKPLLSQLSELAYLNWEQDAKGRNETLHRAAVDALVRFYVDGRTDDELLAETQLAWRAYEKQRSIPLRRRQLVAAHERYRAKWARWAASNQA